MAGLTCANTTEFGLVQHNVVVGTLREDTDVSHDGTGMGVKYFMRFTKSLPFISTFLSQCV